MDGNKPKEGMSVREIENFAKKHRFEVFFCLAFVLACFFTFVMWGPGWSVIAASIGAIIGVLLAGNVTHFSKKVFQFIFKQEQTTQLVLGIVALILAIFLPPLYFLLLGLHGGKDMHHWAMEVYNQNRQP
ncbi:MAG: hypothetical protein HYX67_08115 [Candidatus Melainabacteria bacterium]|nr:hypothetical protein [Candidatus Melainabacteria bacterium]